MHQTANKIDWAFFAEQWDALIRSELRNYEFPEPPPDDDTASERDGSPPTLPPPRSRRGSRVRLNMLSEPLERFLPPPGSHDGYARPPPSILSDRHDHSDLEAASSSRPTTPRSRTSSDARGPASPSAEYTEDDAATEWAWYAHHTADSAYAAQAKAQYEAELHTQRLKHAERAERAKQAVLALRAKPAAGVDRVDHAERAAQAEQTGPANAASGWSGAQTADLRRRIEAMNLLNLNRPPILSWDQHGYKALCALLKHYQLEQLWPTELSRRELVHNAWHFCPPYPDVAAGLWQLAAEPLACALGAFSNASRPLIEQNAAAWRLPWHSATALGPECREHLPHFEAWAGLAVKFNEAQGNEAAAGAAPRKKGKMPELARTVVVGSRVDDLWRAKLYGFRVAYVARAGEETARRAAVRRAKEHETWCDYWVLQDGARGQGDGKASGGFVELARQVQEDLTKSVLAELQLADDDVEKGLVEGKNVEGMEGGALTRTQSHGRALFGGEHESASA